jgi:hypothetical protein
MLLPDELPQSSGEIATKLIETIYRKLGREGINQSVVAHVVAFYMNVVANDFTIGCQDRTGVYIGTCTQSSCRILQVGGEMYSMTPARHSGKNAMKELVKERHDKYLE